MNLAPSQVRGKSPAKSASDWDSPGDPPRQRTPVEAGAGAISDSGSDSDEAPRQKLKIKSKFTFHILLPRRPG